MSLPRGVRGFTLLELMIVVMVIGVLVSVAVPRISMSIRKANEAATLGKLRSLRTAIQLYYAGTEGTFPADLTPFTTPGSKYYVKITPLYTAAHGNSSNVAYPPAYDAAGDQGSWAYVALGGDAGRVWVSCTHTDVKNAVWNQY